MSSVVPNPLQSCIPNVYDGTECGKIQNADETLIGRRVVHEEHFGTICFVGVLPNSRGVWLGVDWDNPTRGRHDGSYNGIRYFHCKSESSGSFVRPGKVSLGTSIEEALVYRYATCAECQLTAQNIPLSVGGSSEKDVNSSGHSNLPGNPAEYSGAMVDDVPFQIEIFSTPAVGRSGHKHENCGAAGAKSALSRLKTVCLSLVPVYRSLQGNRENFENSSKSECASLWPLTGGCLGQLLTSLLELDLSYCLLSTWRDVAYICVQLPWLKTLNISNNRLRLPRLPDAEPIDLTLPETTQLRLTIDVDSDPIICHNLFLKAFPQINQLTLVRSPLLNWLDVARIICWFPCLKSLALAYCPLGNIPNNLDPKAVSTLRNLIELDLSNTGLTDVTELVRILGSSIHLDSLIMNNNELDCLSNLSKPDQVPETEWFPNLSTLGLKRNKFNDWQFASQLLNLPKLKHLLITECPVLEKASLETSRQELIARLPSLITLDRVEISSDERRGAELDYLRRYAPVWRSSNGDKHETNDETPYFSPAFSAEHPVFARLCQKYGVPDVGESKLTTHTLKEGLISVTFLLQRSSEKQSNQLKNPNDSKSQPNTIDKKIPVRMTVAHLKVMIRRLFRLPPKTTFELYAQGSRHKSSDLEVHLDVDTREVTFYGLEDGDTIFVRIEN